MHDCMCCFVIVDFKSSLCCMYIMYRLQIKIWIELKCNVKSSRFSLLSKQWVWRRYYCWIEFEQNSNCQINFHSIKCHFSCILADYKAILTQTFKTNVLLLVLLIIYTIKASSFWDLSVVIYILKTNTGQYHEEKKSWVKIIC
jgi:hypothetical protein